MSARPISISWRGSTDRRATVSAPRGETSTASMKPNGAPCRSGEPEGPPSLFCGDLLRSPPHEPREAAMATKAYILVKVKAGKTKDVVKALKTIAGVQQVHPCFGQPDIFSFIEVHDEKALSDVRISKIQTIDAVEQTDTHIDGVDLGDDDVG